jgi:hypothetical protein
MKKLFLLIVISWVNACAFGQTGVAIYSISEDTIVQKNEFIDAFYIDNSTTITPYEYISSISEVLMSDSCGWSMTLHKFNGYENEPGMCNRIELLKKGTTYLSLQSSNGFEPISSYVNTETGNFTLATLDANNYALIFTEYIYANDPSMVSIILIHKGQAKLVYNKRMVINSITKQTGSFNMELQSNIIEENNQAGSPDLHTLWWDGIVLKFQ